MAPILARNAAYLNVPFGVVVKLTSGLSMTDSTKAGSSLDCSTPDIGLGSSRLVALDQAADLIPPYGGLNPSRPANRLDTAVAAGVSSRLSAVIMAPQTVILIGEPLADFPAQLASQGCGRNLLAGRHE